MAVSREQLEAQLERIASRVRDPRHGLFGPGSLVWTVNREQMMFLAGGRAALLQEAHPFVAYGVDQHSATRTDPQGRFRRTFKHVHAMVFGDLDSAFTAARRVHAIHCRVRGTLDRKLGAHAAGAPYEANAEHALLWVHATLWESSVDVFERIFRPLSLAEKREYYQQTKLFAYLFGISDDTLPPTWEDFLTYNRRMWASDQLAVDRVGHDLVRFLFTPPTPALSGVMRWYRLVTAGLLPPPVRALYGLPWTARDGRVLDASLAALRAAIRATPRRYRYSRAYRRARRRVGQPLRPTLAERLGSRLAA